MLGLVISTAGFTGPLPLSRLHRSHVVLRSGGGDPAAVPSTDAAPDVSVAAAGVAAMLAGSLQVPHYPHVRDWLPDEPSLQTPFHGGCTVDVETLETEECVVPDGESAVFVEESTVVLANPVVDATSPDLGGLVAWKAAGPRESVFFSAGEAKAAIVTCGGLCPGLNTVVKEVVACLRSQYGVEDVYGVRNGYMGFYTTGFEPLTLADVETIHREAGSMLGSSRGGHDTAQICDAIEAAGVNLVFTIGGDGTMKGSSKLADEFAARASKVAVVHVPKTIDNDVPLIDCSFGFGTAVSKAVEAIHVARDEAVAYPNGVGLVNLMGRHSVHPRGHLATGPPHVPTCARRGLPTAAATFATPPPPPPPSHPPTSHPSPSLRRASSRRTRRWRRAASTSASCRRCRLRWTARRGCCATSSRASPPRATASWWSPRAPASSCSRPWVGPTSLATPSSPRCAAVAYARLSAHPHRPASTRIDPHRPASTRIGPHRPAVSP